MTIIQDYYREVSIGKKTLTAWYEKAYGSYSKQLGIPNCMCVFVKDSLLCKFVTNFYVLL